ncbi:MAG: TetR/AcrR family transcriptional regulator [Porticoccaceae bacterium]
MTKRLIPRANPVQNRARMQREKILNVTSELLKTVGLDDLTTILIAKKVGISIGTLYHYFPNKHAILYALSELWVEKIIALFNVIDSENIEQIELKPFVNYLLDEISKVYNSNASLLPLVSVMQSTPEFEEIYNQYQTNSNIKLKAIIMRLPISLTEKDASHVAVIYWQICHSVMQAINLGIVDNDKAIADLKYILLSMLEHARVSF